MRRGWTILLCCLMTSLLWAEGVDSVSHRKGFFRKAYEGAAGLVKKFSEIDTSYVEPQHYKFCTTLMSTYFFETYIIKNKSGHSLVLAPEARVKFGPYIGWSFLFWGYTVDLAYISANKKRELDLSVYTSMLGVDFFMRNSGKDYKIRSLDMGDEVDTDAIEDVPFDGLNVSITGLNAYIIPNHKRFSYPAAFTQSTCQRRSAGSFMFGGGYTRHTLDFDYNKLRQTVDEKLPEISEKLDSGMLFNTVKYTDVSISAGYGYNWVFSKNWLLSVSLSAALGYKHSTGDRWLSDFNILRDFSFSNISIDGVGRFGLIWNNSKWYFGAYSVVHSYNYKKSQFETSNYFGNVNVYIGINFGRKKSHRNYGK